MASVEDVYDLMDRAYELPYGQAKSALLEEALRHAEALGDRDLAFEVRLNLTEAYQYGAEPAKSFATFSRCLAEYDADPARFTDTDHYNLLWQFKWIVYNMTYFPEVPLPRARDALAEMERRYQAAGYGLHAVYAHHCYLAQHVGDRDAAAEWFHRWQTTPRDDLSDCEGCDPSGKVDYLAWAGRDEEAVELAAPVVAEELTCEVQPQGILTNLLLPYLRTGRHEQAAAAHRRAYRIIRGDASYLAELGEHIRFCALTGNEARGLEILERELPLLERAGSPRVAMIFAAAAGLLLRRLAETGHGSAPVRRGGAEVTVDALRAEMESTAREIAARFDTRNGSAEQSRQVEETLAAEPLVDHLPLLPHARRSSAPPPPPAPVADDPGGLLDEAERHWERGDLEAAFAAWERYDAIGGSPGDAHAGRRADGLGLAAAVRGRFDEAVRRWRDAALAHERAGDEPRRQACLGRLGLALCELGEAEEGLALVEASTAYLIEHGDADRAAGARGRLARAYARTGRTEDAVALLRSALDAAEPPRAADGDLMILLARLLAESGDDADIAEAERLAGRGRRALRGRGGPDLADACMLHAALLTLLASEAEDMIETAQEALGAYEEALAAAPRSDAGLRATAHARRGELLLTLGKAAEAADDLVEAVAAFTALGSADRAALARAGLCRAYLATGRPLEAAETAEEALAMLPRDHDVRAVVRLTHGRALRELGEPEAAVDAFAEAADALDERSAPPEQIAEAHEAAGEILARLPDRRAEAAGHFAAAAERYDGVDRARMLRLQALMLYGVEGRDQVFDILARARTVLDALPHDDPAVLRERAQTAFEQGGVLEELNRAEEAADRYAEAADAFAGVGDHHRAAMAAQYRDRLRASGD